MRVADIEQRKSNEMIGAELGYHYFGSPLVWPEEGEGPAYDFVEYTPSTWPGVRLPHTWLDDGTAMQDRIGYDRGFTLLRLGKSQADVVGAATQAFAAYRAPFRVLDIPDARAARGLRLRPHPAAAGHARRVARQPPAGRRGEARGDRDGALMISAVMRGLDPRIHHFRKSRWIAGSRRFAAARQRRPMRTNACASLV